MANGRKWLCREDSQSVWDNWNPQNPENKTWVDSVEIIDENGNWEEVEAWVCNTTDSLNNLDLEDLKNGEISWH